ncbi:MAG TPA: EAL domain-containing response regulator [Aliidongia sp.]|uniref:EAL domain-containing response regulator n=1 Tax=Aliidongia sp. TaxID=1914230 RepID=UPI002DDCF7B1|nr:EAL domain-containing response regulator [Aliidongia sp.]HEV2678354.1 EAL domain-containing response regulator [Aliidongia sp.]
MNGTPPAFSALVIDDDAFTRTTTVRALKAIGAEVTYQAANGAEALSLLGWQTTIDVIICDLNMPEVDGLETLRRLAEHNRHSRIILASGADSRVLRAAREAALAFGLPTVQTMAKPVTVAKLREAIVEPRPERSLFHVGPTVAITIEELERGLAAPELIAYYQPKVSFQTRQLTGTEALVRWKHPTHGLLSPAAFLPLVQAADKLEALTELVLVTAIAQCAAWRRCGVTTVVSVNLPIVSLLSRALPARIDAILAEHAVEPSQLTLEVTEDGWLQQQSVAREVGTRLRVRGFGLSIDDFGTGYSTHQQLLSAPFNELKLDQSFVSKAVVDAESRIVLASSIAMAHKLDLEVVAEGVETQAQWDLLAELGCDVAQGYLVARPMPGDQLVAWKAAWDAAI